MTGATGSLPSEVDVLVVGGGNAGFSAAAAAAVRGRSVLIVEKAPRAHAGGNSYYTAGAIRVSHDGLEDLLPLLDPDPRHEVTILPPYPPTTFRDDMERVTEGRCDPFLTDILVSQSRDAVSWLKSLGLDLRLMYERQAYQDRDGRYRFWGGLALGTTGGGEGLMAGHQRSALRAGVQVAYDSPGRRLVMADDRVTGLEIGQGPHEGSIVSAETVILAAGGFEASPELRRRYLGPGWENAKLRGTPFNTGDMLLAAIDVGAARWGDWNSCHSVAWDAGGENESNRLLTNRLTRQSYQLGIVVNREGVRFVDEGADFRNYTYAKYGREILAQPGSVAFQLFDAKLRPMLRTEEYDMPGITFYEAQTLEELSSKAGIDRSGLVGTVQAFNESIDPTVTFDPSIKDGRSADVVPPKSNWASPLDSPPYYAYAVTCGITFTFGGLQSDSQGRVVRTDGQTVPGLSVCGEMLGGLFSGNYPGGSGLSAGTVFGRLAGLHA